MLRLSYLADRPMHADEAIQADRFGTLLEKHSFLYDPSEHHGPVLAYATLPAAWIARQWRYADLNEWTIRLAPALAGLVLVLLSRAIGNVAAALFTAVSPVLVYYSRDYIPEMFLLLLSAGLLWAVLQYQKSPGPRWAVVAGIFAGLMYGAKETAVLVFVALGVACLAARFRFRRVDLGIIGLVAIASAALLLRPGDWVRSSFYYVARAGSGGIHPHPWYFYVLALTPSGDVLWLLAGVAAFACLAKRNRMVVFLGAYALILTVLYSVLPYKTPWCAAGPVHAWILTVAVGLPALWESRWRRVAFAGCVLLTGTAFVQAVRYSFPLAADSRNPYAYAHTTRDVFVIRERILKVALGQPSGYATGIDVLAGENWWPLPWYLRRFSQVRWWSAPPRTGHPGPIVLCSPGNEEALARLLYEVPPPGQRELFVSLFPQPVWLRPGVEVRGYLAASLPSP